jgi:hypothetical protein
MDKWCAILPHPQPPAWYGGEIPWNSPARLIFLLKWGRPSLLMRRFFNPWYRWIPGVLNLFRDRFFWKIPWKELSVTSEPGAGCGWPMVMRVVAGTMILSTDKSATGFSFSGGRDHGLQCLDRCGGWVRSFGVRRPLLRPDWIQCLAVTVQLPASSLKIQIGGTVSPFCGSGCQKVVSESYVWRGVIDRSELISVSWSVVSVGADWVVETSFKETSTRGSSGVPTAKERATDPVRVWCLLYRWVVWSISCLAYCTWPYTGSVRSCGESQGTGCLCWNWINALAIVR